MSSVFPSTGIARKFGTAISADNTALADTVTVTAVRFGILWKLWVDLDVTDTTDIGNLVDPLLISVTMGSTVFANNLHPYIAHATNQDHIDLGPWPYDFGVDGLYSGVKGDDIVFAVAAAGTGIKSRINYIYSGD